MRNAVPALALAGCLTASGQDVEKLHPQELLTKAVIAARARADSLSNYACTALIERRRCVRPHAGVESKCAACPQEPALLLAQTDRLRVEVGVSQRGEMFSWPDDASFRYADLDRLAGGGTTTVGEFASFPVSILLTDTEPGDFAFADGAFSFHISSTRSHFAIRGRGANDYITAYRGRMWVDSSGKVRRIEVVVADPPPESALLQVRIVIDYNDLIPRHARTTVLWPDGTAAINDTEYSNCRVFGSESKIIWDLSNANPSVELKHEPSRLLPGSEVSVALVTPIDSTADVTGQRIEGRLLRPLRAADGQIVADRDTKIRGRIVRLEHYHCPVSNFVLGLRFDELLLDDQWIPVKLAAPDYHPVMGRSSRGGYIPPREAEMALVPEESRPGVQSFVFRDRERLRLGPQFVSKWRVSE